MNTKICTSIEQSKKLLSLGLDPSTSDMYYCIWRKPSLFVGSYERANFINGDNKAVPAWSLAALLGMIPLYTLEQTTDGKVIAVSEIGQYSKCSEVWDSPIDAAFEMICWLIEHGHIKVNK